MSPQELQDGADWLYVQYYRLDRIILRTLRALFKVGFFSAVLTWRLNMTYRYDNKLLKLKGKNPMKERSGYISGYIERFLGSRTVYGG